jgi:hypothetical protein
MTSYIGTAWLDVDTKNMEVKVNGSKNSTQKNGS